jgi:alpha-L-arabinofuranosidase
VKVVNTTDKAQTADVAIESAKKLSSKGKLVVLKSDQLDAVNSFDKPQMISPTEQDFAVKGKKASVPLAPNSFSILKIKVQ